MNNKYFFAIIFFQLVFFISCFIYITQKKNIKIQNYQKNNIAKDKAFYSHKAVFFDNNNNNTLEFPILIFSEKQIAMLKKDVGIIPQEGFGTLFLINKSKYFFIQKEAVADNYIIHGSIGVELTEDNIEQITNRKMQVEFVSYSKNLINQEESGIKIDTDNSFIIQFKPKNTKEIDKIKNSSGFKIVNQS